MQSPDDSQPVKQPIATGYKVPEDAPVARYVPFETLLKCSRAVKTRGKDLIYQYAGDDPQKRFVTFGSRRIARQTAFLLLRDLRAARTDDQYNRIIDSFRETVRDSQQIERDGEQMVQFMCPTCDTVITCSPTFADRVQDFCPKCNAAEPAVES